MVSRLCIARTIPCILAATFFLAAAITPCVCFAQQSEWAMPAAVDAVRPALVRIHVVTTNYDQGRESKMESFGSGVIISQEGYAITNHHVAADAERIVCTLSDKTEVDAKLVGADALSDIAVIKLEKKVSGSNGDAVFSAASFEDSSTLKVGDKIFAMGCPWAISQSVTQGIVSNVEMVMPSIFGDEALVLQGEDVGSIVRWIGHDALIEPGNSGGPLVNDNGKIVGINEISMGLAGAIPSNLARDVADQLIKNGRVRRAWFGAQVQPLLKSSEYDKGLLISGFLADSPAAAAGFESGDILIALNGKEVGARFKEEIPIFNQYVADLPIDTPIEAVVLRDGTETKLTVTPTERKSAIDKEHEIKSWGMCATNITFVMQKEKQLDSRDGVLVTSVLPSGGAGSAKLPLTAEDVIVKVANRPVKDIDSLRNISRELLGFSENKAVVVEFRRKQREYASVVTIGKKEETNPGAEVTKAWLPIEIQVITKDLADALGLGNKTGVRVTKVYKSESAEKAGIKVGDIIVKLDGEDVPAEQVGDEEVFDSIIRQYDVGTTIELGIIRDGKTVKTSVELAESPVPVSDYPKHTDDDFEFTTRDIAFSDKADGSVAPASKGVYVESVAEGGWATLGGMRAGDVIVEIDGQAVQNLESFKDQLEAIREKKPKAVTVRVEREIYTLYLELKSDWQE